MGAAAFFAAAAGAGLPGAWLEEGAWRAALQR
jgi:hypothetical protein